MGLIIIRNDSWASGVGPTSASVRGGGACQSRDARSRRQDTAFDGVLALTSSGASGLDAAEVRMYNVGGATVSPGGKRLLC